VQSDVLLETYLCSIVKCLHIICQVLKVKSVLINLLYVLHQYFNVFISAYVCWYCLHDILVYSSFSWMEVENPSAASL